MAHILWLLLSVHDHVTMWQAMAIERALASTTGVVGVQNDIVVRVAIVGDQTAAMVVACQLNRGWVDGVNRGHD